MIISNSINLSAVAISAENLTLAWQTPLVGMVMIFAVLGFLWAILSVFKLVFYGKDTPSEKSKADTSTPADNATTPAATPAVAVPTQQSDAELVAILTAAVAAYMADNGEDASMSGGFRVVSFKRVRGARSWNTK